LQESPSGYSLSPRPAPPREPKPADHVDFDRPPAQALTLWDGVTGALISAVAEYAYCPGCAGGDDWPRLPARRPPRFRVWPCPRASASAGPDESALRQRKPAPARPARCKADRPTSPASSWATQGCPAPSTKLFGLDRLLPRRQASNSAPSNMLNHSALNRATMPTPGRDRLRRALRVDELECDQLRSITLAGHARPRTRPATGGRARCSRPPPTPSDRGSGTRGAPGGRAGFQSRRCCPGHLPAAHGRDSLGQASAFFAGWKTTVQCWR
jgi:hypothetical protein